jgi:shikimate dehydrogenase
MPRVGVLGWPVAHSRSPAMHAAGFAALGLTGWTYQRLPVPPELLAETTRALAGAGFVGANVTIPHKMDALELADEATPAARAIGAANTLWFEDGALHADNTDAPGFLAALPEPPAGWRALVLGAGGSARAVVWALLQARAADVQVWNRTAERAERLCREIGGRVVREPEPADLLVNCTSVGLTEHPATFKDLPSMVDSSGSYRCVVDLVYRAGGTALIAAAQTRGIPVVDGLEILVRQGALSFEHWTERPAPIDAMREAARQT